MPHYDYDLITIGGGSGGVRASRMSAAHGARVALVECGPLGGTCVNVGCIPKKLFSFAAHFSADFDDARGYGWSMAAQPLFDWNMLLAAKDREISRLNGVYARILGDAGVKIIAGRARVVDAHTVAVDGQVLTGRHLLVATGGYAVKPGIPGAELGITSDQAFHLDRLPRRAVLVGGGYIAVEFASIFRGLGVETTLVHRGERLLRGFDTDLGRVLTEELGRGITLLLNETVRSLAREQEALRVTLGSGTALTTDLVMFATGRNPNVDGLGLDVAGVGLAANGAVQVDDFYCSSVPSIHAIGDVIDRVQLTPVAIAEGMCLARTLFKGERKALDYRNIATAVFSHPHVGTVGLTEAEARAQYAAVDIYQTRFRPLKATLSGAGEKVYMKLVVDHGSDRVIGVHMVGAEAGEIIQGFAVALNCGATKAQFDATVGIHPTTAEEFVTLRS